MSDYSRCSNCGEGGQNTTCYPVPHGWQYHCKDCSNSWFVDPELIDWSDDEDPDVCPDCDGVGDIEETCSSCPTCGGSGYLS